MKVKVDIVTSDDIKIYYTGKFQVFTARYIIKFNSILISHKIPDLDLPIEGQVSSFEQLVLQLFSIRATVRRSFILENSRSIDYIASKRARTCFWKNASVEALLTFPDCYI